MQGQKSKGEIITEDKKLLNNEELEKVNGGTVGDMHFDDQLGGSSIIHPKNTQGWFGEISNPNVVGYDQKGIEGKEVKMDLNVGDNVL